VDRTRKPLSPKLGGDEREYVFAVAMKYMKDEEAAADVAQDAMLLAHRHRHSFQGNARFSTWLYRIAATTALMHLRRRRQSREVLTTADADADSSYFDHSRAAGCGPDEHAANSEAVEVMRERLAKLGASYIDIFWMRYLEGYTESEIAAQLDLTIATVKTRAHRAKVAVRDQLRRDLSLAA